MRWCFSLFLLGMVVLCDAAGVREGMTQLQVEATLGKPMAALRRGDRIVLTYPKGGKVVLEHDRVVEMVNVEVGNGGAPVKPVETPPVEEGDFEATQASSTAREASTGERAPEDPVASAADALEALEKAQEEEPPPGSSQPWMVLLLASALRILFVMVVLKLAFRWADVHADWGQMFLPALAETLVLVGFAVVGQILLNVHTWFYLDEAVSYFVLLFVLMKSTHACTIMRAVSVAGAAKLMSIVVGAGITALVLGVLA